MHDDHSHALTGSDFGLMQRGVMVFRLRESRTFDAKGILHATAVVKGWARRYASRHCNSVVDEASFTIFQDVDRSVLVLVFTLWYGFKEDYLCWAQASADAPDPQTRASDVLAALMQAQTGPDVSLPDEDKKPERRLN